jgi:hypothetical protein
LLEDLEARAASARSPEDEPWGSLWSALCHQGDVYTASYAALPHIVRIGMNVQGPVDFSFLMLPARIEIARAQGSGPAISDELRPAYAEAVNRLPECVYQQSKYAWDLTTTQAAACAIAASKGQFDFADAVCMLDEDMIPKIISGDLTE